MNKEETIKQIKSSIIDLEWNVNYHKDKLNSYEVQLQLNKASLKQLEE